MSSRLDELILAAPRGLEGKGGSMQEDRPRSPVGRGPRADPVAHGPPGASDLGATSEGRGCWPGHIWHVLRGGPTTGWNGHTAWRERSRQSLSSRLSLERSVIAGSSSMGVTVSQSSARRMADFTPRSRRRESGAGSEYAGARRS
jgi:hypothetical protein